MNGGVGKHQHEIREEKTPEDYGDSAPRLPQVAMERRNKRDILVQLDDTNKLYRY